MNGDTGICTALQQCFTLESALVVLALSQLIVALRKKIDQLIKLIGFSYLSHFNWIIS